MKRLKITGACLVASLAVTGIATASASAEAPEFGRCLKKAVVGGSGFSNSTCTSGVSTGAKFEWTPELVNRHFVVHSKEGTKITLETVKKEKLVCNDGVSGGDYTGPKTVGNISVTFHQCEGVGLKCNTQGAQEGELVFTSLEGRIAVEKLGETPLLNKVAFDLFPSASQYFNEFKCGGFNIRSRGSILVPATVNKMLTSVTEKWTATKGKQHPEGFEGEPTDVIESSFAGSAFEQSAATGTAIQTNEEAIEINTVA